MTSKEITIVALKCFAIYMSIQLLISIPSFITMGYQFVEYGYLPSGWIARVLIPVLSILLGGVAVVMLWKFSNNLVTKHTPSVDVDAGWSPHEVMKVVLTCMGLYFFIDALLALPYSFVNFQMTKGVENYNISMAYTDMATRIFELLLGCALMFKPAKWIQKIRTIQDKHDC